MDDILEYVQIGHDDKECQEGKDDEILHHCRLALAALTATPSAENKGLVSIAECLGNQCHNHGYFDACAIDAQLHLAIRTRDKMTINNLVGHLIQDARHTQQEQRPRVAQHFPHKASVDTMAQIAQFGKETKRHPGSTQQVDRKHIAHLPIGIVPPHQSRMGDAEPGRHEEHKEVKADIANNKEELECGELPCLSAETKPGKEDGLKGIQGHHAPHHHHILGMGGVTHRLGDGHQQETQQDDEQRTDTAHRQRRSGEHRLGTVLVLVGEIEEGRLHAEGENHQHERRVGIQFGHHAIASRRGGYFVGIQRNQQVVEESPHYAADAVNHRVREESFKIVSHVLN